MYRMPVTVRLTVCRLTEHKHFMNETASPENSGLIDRYCATEGITLKQFEERAEVSRTALYRIRTGDPEVSTAIFDKIDKATKGAVSAVALFAEWHARRQAARPATAQAN